MKIISRAAAGLRAPRRDPIPVTRPALGVVVHHTVTGPGGDLATVREVQRYHMDTLGWSDEAYSFFILADGTIVEGRGWDWDHLTVLPSLTISVAVVGSLHEHAATPAQIDALGWLIAYGILTGHLSGGFLGGHRDFAPADRPTTCPGDHGIAAGHAAHLVAVDIIHSLTTRRPPPMVIVVHPSGHREMSDGIRRRPFLDWDEFVRYRDAGVPVINLTADQFHHLEPAGRR